MKQVEQLKQFEIFPNDSEFNSTYALRKRHKENLQEYNSQNGIDNRRHVGAPVVDLVGQRFGKLLVTEQTNKRHNGEVVFVCTCDCGHEILVTGRKVKRKKNPLHHCGCMGVGKDHKYKPGALGITWGKRASEEKELRALFSSLYAKYRQNATNRGYTFKLSKDEFLRLTSANCFYCGCVPSQNFEIKGRDAVYIYNGIDRVNPSIGYVVDNCVTCCWTCNQAKGVMTGVDFHKWINKVYETINNKA